MAAEPDAGVARRIRVRGRIQGVGFRPFAVRLARHLGLHGWVRNLAGDAEIHVEGGAAAIDAFIERLVAEAPPLAQPESTTVAPAESEGLADFGIRHSQAGVAGPVVIPPDHFVCPDCLAEMADPAARRYRYPFTNCTQCGPRYTIIDTLPYDRAGTAMAGFALCAPCQAEFDDPADRRFHAQPLACPRCGPGLSFHAPGAAPLAGNEAALAAALAALRRGLIVAVKGIGGYHLLCDARDQAAVQRLRERKHRPAKPLAVMVTEQLLDGDPATPAIAHPSAAERALLCGPQRPIVLVRKAEGSGLAEAVAPGLAELGLMLPYSPLHHLLLQGLAGPLVATSANLSGEPVLTDAEAVERALGAVADAFLHHDRPIRRPADDSVFRTLGDGPRPLRLGRGLAPVELRLARPVAQALLALGADLKNTVALAVADRVLLSPHLGDLGSPHSLRVFEQVIDDLCRLHGVQPGLLVCDAHPGYFSHHWARERGLAVRPVLHHHAHASALHGELGDPADGAPPLLVFTWDGLGWGEDGTLWGGEALLGAPGRWRRVASLRPFRLIGGDRASRDPWRCALALCLEAGVTWPGQPPEGTLAGAAWQRRLNSPPTSSAGRLFDAAAALIGVCQRQSHEGEAAMRLETLAAQAAGAVPGIALPLHIDAGGVWRTDWSPLLPRLMAQQRPPAERAALFHASLAGALCAQARQIRLAHGVQRVGLAGGVFQNRLLTQQALAALQAAGFEVLLPRRLPVNDAAIAFGQIVEAQATLAAAAPPATHPP
jgi:hydrogenase maturation protein HypF